MLYKNRVWHVSVVESRDELAEMLTQHVYTPCTAFELEDVLFLNDSTGPDGAQEYAVVKCVDGEYFQIESITFGWCSRERARELIDFVLDEDTGFKIPVQPAFSQTNCYLCA